jgi:hypothetical protein
LGRDFATVRSSSGLEEGAVNCHQSERRGARGRQSSRRRGGKTRRCSSRPKCHKTVRPLALFDRRPGVRPRARQHAQTAHDATGTLRKPALRT